MSKNDSLNGTTLPLRKIRQRESAVPKHRYGRYQIADIITYANMFYKSKNKYFYFNGFRTFASNLCFYGVSVERGKCTTSYIGISQIERKGFSPCSEKEFWENCKDKVGYVTYRYNIK